MIFYFAVSHLYLQVTLKVMWEMKDQSGNDQVCVELGVKVEN